MAIRDFAGSRVVLLFYNVEQRSGRLSQAPLQRQHLWQAIGSNFREPRTRLVDYSRLFRLSRTSNRTTCHLLSLIVTFWRSCRRLFFFFSSSPSFTDSDDLSNACELAASLIPVCSAWLNKLNELASRRWRALRHNFALIFSRKLMLFFRFFFVNTFLSIQKHIDSPPPHTHTHTSWSSSSWSSSSIWHSFVASVCVDRQKKKWCPHLKHQ